jgi:hypothetical protein
MHTLEQINPIHVLTARVNGLEAATRKLEAEKQELHRKMAMVMAIKPIKESRELKITNAVRYEGNSATSVDKRYRIWQVLYENGYTVSSISRAWNVDRKLVQYAHNNGWRSKYIKK